jgi:hypothetical protein
MALFRALESSRRPAAARRFADPPAARLLPPPLRAVAAAARLRRASEPWTFGLDPAEIPAYLAARGFALIADVGADEYRARYLGATGHGYAFYRVVQARVAGATSGGRG